MIYIFLFFSKECSGWHVRGQRFNRHPNVAIRLPLVLDAGTHILPILSEKVVVETEHKIKFTRYALEKYEFIIARQKYSVFNQNTL